MLKFINQKENQLLNLAKYIAGISNRIRQVESAAVFARLSNDKEQLEKLEKEKTELLWERQIWTDELYKTK